MRLKTTGTALVLSCLFAGSGLQGQVVISSPENGAIVSSPVQVSAALGAAQLSSIAVYNDGLLVFQQQGVSSIATSLNLSTGTHTIVVKATSKTGSPSSAMTLVTVSTAEPQTWGAAGAGIAADMAGKNEGVPQGVPLSYAWATHPAVAMGNNPGGWRAITAWGVVYVASQGNPAVNTRVNIRGVQTYFLQKSTGKWLLLQNTSTPAGGAYLNDFSLNITFPGDMRTEPDGTISVTAGSGYNYHFYPSGRASINPGDIGGIVTIFQARLIMGNPALRDDRSTAFYLAGAGGDYYPGLTGTWPGNLPYNPGIAIGKEKYVRSYWRFFSMTTMTAAQLQKNPPPIDLSGIEP